ncbi:MAG: isoprenylcysteine carboxylmethyltransferase family protein [Candidatus Omnitrophota bacterium]
MHRFLTETVFSSLYGIITVLFACERMTATISAARKSVKQPPQLLTTIPLLTYCLLAFAAVIEYFIGSRALNYWISACGFAIFMTGIKLRTAAIKEFADNWNIHITAKSIKKIITSGPYCFVRHPYYLAVILELTGFSLISNSYFTLTAVALIQLPLLLMRIDREEKELEDKFPGIYLPYKKTVNALLPALRGPLRQTKGR